MAFRAGFLTENEEKIGKDVEFSSPDVSGFMREVFRTKDTSWEGAIGAHPMTSTNKWGHKCYKHLFSFKMIQCDSVCWRIGVCSEEFPVHNLWHWWDKYEHGIAPPWAVFLCGGKTEVVAVKPPSILKAGGTVLNYKIRQTQKPEFEGRFEKDCVADEIGRLRLKAGDTVGVAIDTGSHNGDGTVTFFVNGIQVHETVHIFSEVGEDWIPYVALGSDKIKVRMLSTGEALAEGVWDTAEEHEIRKANIDAERGETKFPGAGWLLRKEESRKWARGWYMLTINSFKWTPYSILYITLHKGKNLAAMDADGFSDPYVEFRCGKEPWTSKTVSEQGFTVVKSKVIYKSLDPVWKEKLELKLLEFEGVLSITCKDKDMIGSNTIGEAHINMADIFKLSCSAGGIRRLDHKWYTLSNGIEAGSNQGELLLSMYVGEVKSDIQVSKKNSLFGRSRRSTEMGEMMLRDIARIRSGTEFEEADVVFDWHDPSKDGEVTQIVLRSEKREDAALWLAEIIRSVTFRTVTSKALARVKGFLSGDLPRPRKTTGELETCIDPSSFFDLGFSRFARKWAEHPLKTTHKKLREDYPTAFECQFSDEDVVSISPLLGKNTWISELRLDCFFEVGYVADKAATALAAALKENTSLKSLKLAGNAIGDQGAYYFGLMLRENRTLEILGLEGNKITKTGSVYLLTAIAGDAVNPANKVIKELRLVNCNVKELETGTIVNCMVTGN